MEANLSRVDIFLELGTPLLKIIGETSYADWAATYLEGKVSPRQLPLKERRNYQRDVIAGLHFLHHGVLHRDIKADNVIVVDGRAKLADFGLSLQCLLGERDNRYRRSGMYTVTNRPPEMLRFPKKRDYSFSADVWALGTLLIEIETSSSLVAFDKGKGNYKQRTLECYFAALGLPPLSLYGRLSHKEKVADQPFAVIPDLEERAFFLSLLHYNEQLRPTSEEIEKKFISHLL